MHRIAQMTLYSSSNTQQQIVSQLVTKDSTLKNTEDLLDFPRSFPTFASRRSPADGRKIYSLVVGKKNEHLADYVLFEDSMANYKISWRVYNAMTAEEKMIYMAHYTAIQERKLTYVCPVTKKSFHTLSKLLYDQNCCGEGCRHCPYQLENCNKQSKKSRIWNGCYYI